MRAGVGAGTVPSPAGLEGSAAANGAGQCRRSEHRRQSQEPAAKRPHLRDRGVRELNVGDFVFVESDAASPSRRSAGAAEAPTPSMASIVTGAGVKEEQVAEAATIDSQSKKDVANTGVNRRATEVPGAAALRERPPGGDDRQTFGDLLCRNSLQCQRAEGRRRGAVAVEDEGDVAHARARRRIRGKSSCVHAVVPRDTLRRNAVEGGRREEGSGSARIASPRRVSSTDPRADGPG